MPDALSDLKYTLTDEQQEIVAEHVNRFQQGARHGGLWMPTGTGKTLVQSAIASTIAPELERQSGRKATTWVCMPSDLKYQWLSEITKTDPRIPPLSTSPLHVFVLDADSPTERKNQLEMIRTLKQIGTPPMYVLFSFESLFLSLHDFQRAMDARCDLLFIDEADKIQNEDGGQSKSVHVFAGHAAYRFASSATLAYYRVDDLYSVFMFLDPDAWEDGYITHTIKGKKVKDEVYLPTSSRFWGQKWRFLSRYAVTNSGGTVKKLRNAAELHARMEDFGITMRNEEEMGLPDIKPSVEEVDLYPSQWATHMRAVEGFAKWIHDAGQRMFDNGGVDAVYDHVLAQLIAVRLSTTLSPKQFSIVQMENFMKKNKVEYTPVQMTPDILTDDNAKLDAVREAIWQKYIVDKEPGGFIAYSQWKRGLDVLEAGMPDIAKIMNAVRFDGDANAKKREEIRSGIRNKTIRGVFMNDTGGRGLNFHHSINHSFATDVGWVPTPYRQCNIGRIVRLGQENTPGATIFAAHNTIDTLRMIPNLFDAWDDQNAIRNGERGLTYGEGLAFKDLNEVLEWITPK